MFKLKNLIMCLVVVASLFVITGCSSTMEDSVEEGNSQEEEITQTGDNTQEDSSNEQDDDSSNEQDKKEVVTDSSEDTTTREVKKRVIKRCKACGTETEEYKTAKVIDPSNGEISYETHLCGKCYQYIRKNNNRVLYDFGYEDGLTDTKSKYSCVRNNWSYQQGYQKGYVDGVNSTDNPDSYGGD